MTPTEPITLYERETDIDGVVAQLQAERDALGDVRDVALTERAIEEHVRKTSSLEGRILTIRASQQELRRRAPQVATLERWHADITEIRAVISDELAALKAAAEQSKASREPVQGADMALNLYTSLQVIDHGPQMCAGCGWMLETLRVGVLLRERGWSAPPPPEAQWTNMAVTARVAWHGTPALAAERLRELRAQRDDAQLRLDRAVQGE